MHCYKQIENILGGFLCGPFCNSFSLSSSHILMYIIFYIGKGRIKLMKIKFFSQKIIPSMTRVWFNHRFSHGFTVLR